MRKREMFKITVLGYGYAKKNKSDIKPYLLRTLLKNQINLLKSDKRFHPIGLAVLGMEFPEQIEIVLGVFSSRPLFIKVSRIGNLYFSKPCNEENEGFLLFEGDVEILMGRFAEEIRKEFLEQLQNFLERKSDNEREGGIRHNKISKGHFEMSKQINQKLSSFFGTQFV